MFAPSQCFGITFWAGVLGAKTSWVSEHELSTHLGTRRDQARIQSRITIRTAATNRWLAVPTLHMRESSSRGSAVGSAVSWILAETGETPLPLRGNSGPDIYTDLAAYRRGKKATRIGKRNAKKYVWTHRRFAENPSSAHVGTSTRF